MGWTLPGGIDVPWTCPENVDSTQEEFYKETEQTDAGVSA